MAELKEKLRSKEAEKEALEKGKNNEIAALKESLSDMEFRLEEVQISLEANLDIIEKMKSTNEHANAQSSELKLQLEKANERSAKLLQELQTIAPVAKQVEPLKEELKEALDAKSFEESRSASLALSIQTNQDLLSSKQVTHEKLNTELVDLKSLLEKSEEEVKRLREAAESAKEQHAVSVRALEDEQRQAVGNLKAEITRCDH